MRSLPIKKARVVNTINASAYIADVTYVGRDNPVRVIVSDVDGTPTNLETIITQIGEQYPGTENGQAINYEMMHDRVDRDPANIPKQSGSVRAPTITDCTL